MSIGLGVSPFKIVYGLDPLGPLDLVPRPQEQRPSTDPEQRVDEIQRLHERVRVRIEKSNSSYSTQANKHRRPQVFQPGDLVWIHLRKERFPAQRKTKLMPRADGPYEILERINDNAYKVDLPGDYGVSATFNVADLRPYFDEQYLEDLRANSSSQGENDGGPSQGNLNSQSPLNPSQEEPRGRLQNTLAKVLETWPDGRDHGQTVVSTTSVHHPGCGSCKPPGFVSLIH